MKKYMELVTKMSSQTSIEDLNIHYGIAEGYLECLDDQKLISHDEYVNHYRALVKEYWLRYEELE